MNKGLVTAILGITIVMTAGCFNQDPVVRLNELELENLQQARDTLKGGKNNLKTSLDQLATISAQAFEDQHSLDLSISKAKLLESMKAPWTRPSPELATTQREVILYHLYELSEAEGELVAAQLRERQTAVRKVQESHKQLINLTEQLINAEELILASFDRSPGDRLVAFLGNFLEEAQAFRAGLSDSEDPELQKLVEKTQKAEDRAAQAREVLLMILKDDAEKEE